MRRRATPWPWGRSSPEAALVVRRLDVSLQPPQHDHGRHGDALPRLHDDHAPATQDRDAAARGPMKARSTRLVRRYPERAKMATHKAMAKR
jgi:hypothetical protein